MAELTINNLRILAEKVKEVTGLNCYFNDSTQSADTLKLDLRYKGLTWINPMKRGVLRFDCVLCGMGVSELFIINVANAEIKISEACDLIEASDVYSNNISSTERIIIKWNDDEGGIENETTDKGVNYSYKRYLKLEYQFLNS